MQPTTRNRLQASLLLLLIALAVLTGYTFLHEAGHALAGLAFSGRLTEFSLNFLDLSAHAGLAGEFTPDQEAAINAAGVSLPLLAWLVLMLALPREGGFSLQWAKLFASLGTLNTLLAWVVLPLLYLNGTAPAFDDVTQFIRHSGLPPLAVACGSLAAYALGWALFARRAGDLRPAFSLLRSGRAPLPSWGAMLAGALLLAIFAGVVSLAGSALVHSGSAPPAGALLPPMLLPCEPAWI
jgi:hypothetical protein